jgi:hypothetical protein
MFHVPSWRCHVPKVLNPKPAEELELPKATAACADLYWKTRHERLELDRASKKLQERETALKTYLFSTLEAEGATGISGAVARVEIGEDDEVSVDDFETFWKYVSRTKSWDMLPRSVNRTAIKARWEEGKKVPGVSKVTVKKLGLHKLGR